MFSINAIRTKKRYKYVYAFIAINMLVEIIQPTAAYALTSGPSQPEVQSFEPVSTSDMVNLFSGDFTYNIPLFELPGANGGYPFNLAYHSGIGMDQEASWVGLGWNVNAGALTRSMRGIPDEFDGDQINYNLDMKDNHTYGVSGTGNIEFFGGDAAKAVKSSLSLSLSVYYNNYKGMGLGVGAGFSHAASGSSVGLNLDSQGGTSISADYSLIKKNSNMGKKGINVGVGVTFNSRAGIKGSLSCSMSDEGDEIEGHRKKGGATEIRKKTYSQSHGSSFALSSASNSFVPSLSTETKNHSLNLSFKAGGNLFGVFGSFSIGAFYDVQTLKNKQAHRQAYGLFYAQNADSKYDLMDFNRSNEKVVHKSDRLLPIPNSTPDFYSFTNQGSSGMFRTFRSDVGAFRDGYAKSKNYGFSFGGEVGIGLARFGFDAVHTQGKQEIGEWNAGSWASQYEFYKKKITDSDDYEAAWFGLNGEMTAKETNELDWIGGERAVSAKMKKIGTTSYLPENNILRDRNGNDVVVNASYREKRTDDLTLPTRNLRGTLVQQITNNQLLNKGTPNKEMLNEYKVDYYDYTTGSGDLANAYKILAKTTSDYDRTVNKGHHFAGFTIHNAGGGRSVYGIPAMNNKQVECTFSVKDEKTNCTPKVDIESISNQITYKYPNTDQFYSKTTTPEFAHSYLLTSILGSDYVDVDGNGPSDGDYGYWVKFNYSKVHDAYEWRAPYSGARYNIGSYSKQSDNKGSYVYGQKEIWYLTSVESNSHIAIFELTDRVDALSANGELAALGTRGAQRHKKLSKIKIYSKAELDGLSTETEYYNVNPIQTIHFEYDYTLCKNVENNDPTILDPTVGDGEGSNEGGKLTLKKLYVTYQNNTRGELSPYKFEYNGHNPPYSEFTVNRWGNYEPNATSDYCENLDLPYQKQFDVDQYNQSPGWDSGTPGSYKADTPDNYAESWHLTDITTPSGGKITVNYESDDYSYVQHRKAAQMFKIEGLKGSSGSWDNTTYDNSEGKNKILFTLEKPIVNDINFYHSRGLYLNASTIKEVFYAQYLDGLKREIPGQADYQIYFKVKINLKDRFEDYVNGYADLKDGNVTGTTGSYDVDGDGSSETCYTQGYVEIEPGPDGYNQMAIAAFQYLRNLEPDLLTSGSISQAPGSKASDKARKVKSLLSMVRETVKMFTEYRNYCRTNAFGKKIVLSKSVIRLATPDGVKYGGGTRVKSIAMSDDFLVNNSESTYGQYYDYTMEDPDGTGRTISSGVASFEPEIGGGENALRYAINYNEKMAQKTDNWMYTEYPTNTSYFPSPSVGYERVAVRSLNTQDFIEKNQGASPTGESVSEFYTAREFPTITENTSARGGKRRLFIPIPFVGQIDINRLHKSQGYAIQTNDMHGKPKSVANYGMDNNGDIDYEKPVSSVYYEYLAEDIIYEGKLVKKLVNEVNTVELSYDNAKGKVEHIQKARLLGVQYEFFTDRRRSYGNTIRTGVALNSELLVFIPGIYPWPSFSKNTSEMGLIVTNKIIHRNGILKEVIASDGKSTVSTENLSFDPYTGTPLHTVTKNNWDKDVYALKDMLNYSSVDNQGVSFITTLTAFDDGTQSDTWNGMPEAALFRISESGKQLYPGDEVVLINASGGENAHGVVQFESLTTGNEGHGQELIYAPNATDGGSYMLYVVRSGHRNYINLNIHSLTALSDPLDALNRAEHDDCPSNHELSGATQLAVKNVINAQAGDLKNHWLEQVPDLNPYSSGEKGILRAYQDMAYFAERKQNTNVDLSVDGTYLGKTNDDYYYYPAIIPHNYYLGYELIYLDGCYWKDINTISKYDNYGHTVESSNALGIYSSARYAYNGMLVTAVASDARQSEMMFESFENPLSFEEYTLTKYPSEEELTASDLELNDGHTGTSSLKVDGNVKFYTPVRNEVHLEFKNYLISAWMKLPANTGFTYDDESKADNVAPGIGVTVYDDSWVATSHGCNLRPVGEVINGWQKVEGVLDLSYVIHEYPKYIVLELKSGGSGTIALFDDIRIHPSEGGMQTYVYDPSNYRLIATLDDNNYASLYHYDSQGNLYLVKKETERGIVTISETVGHQKER